MEDEDISQRTKVANKSLMTGKLKWHHTGITGILHVGYQGTIDTIEHQSRWHSPNEWQAEMAIGKPRSKENRQPLKGPANKASDDLK